ncbi:hypothetical protein [Phosphitispora sp. TUW77]|uniref:hypothetical protein n=1 Tax=Phosphitispora sp. TUW77 TaxID=3152361 RepID=UPI003AB25F57
MNFTRFYAAGAIAIGIMQVIDGVLLVLNKGNPTMFNYIVVMFELFWLPVCTIMVFVFKKNKLSMLSPYSYIFYNFIGWTIAALMAEPDAGTVNATMVWFAVIGIAFGIYYVAINDRLFRKLPR